MLPATTPTEVFYMVEGRLIASGILPIHPQFVHQVAYFCTTCGKLWGQVVIPTSPSWQVLSAPCHRHKPTCVQDWGAIPGSLIQRIFHILYHPIYDRPRCLDLVPDALVKYEFLLSLNQWSQDESS